MGSSSYFEEFALNVSIIIDQNAKNQQRKFCWFLTMLLFYVIRVLVVNSLHFVQKHFRHQDTKTQSLFFTNSFALGLCAFVAICSPPSADPG
jgi:hypothetical protein